MRKNLAYTDLETKVTLMQPDFKEIANVINSVIALYKVCDKKELVDSVLENIFINPRILVQTENPINLENETENEKNN